MIRFLTRSSIFLQEITMKEHLKRFPSKPADACARRKGGEQSEHNIEGRVSFVRELSLTNLLKSLIYVGGNLCSKQ